MVDADVMPYEVAKRFQYHGEWTGSLFTPLRTIVRVMGIDSHEELTDAWEAMVRAGVRENDAFDCLSARGGWPSVRYQATSKRIRSILKSEDAVREVRMQRELGEFFRANYREVVEELD
jgi:hypothetical protein